MKHPLSLCFILFLSACNSGNPQYYLNLYDIKSPTAQNFTHCLNYGCQTRNLVSLPKTTHKKLTTLFKNTKSAEDERTKVTQAIQIFEKDIGALTGTHNDKHGTFRIYQDDSIESQRFQQDCIDESTNTTIYLMLLQDLNLLTYNTPFFPASRSPIGSGSRWWHQTAVIQDIETKQRYAVDSWFFDNGEKAVIKDIESWKAGWNPPK